MKYQQILNNLQESINHKHNNELFIKSLQDFKGIGFNISTKFLRNLCITRDNRKRTLRINYLLRACNLKTKKQSRFSSRWTGESYNITITEYTNDKGYKLRAEEKAFIKNTRTENIGKVFISNFREVLYFVII